MEVATAARSQNVLLPEPPLQAATPDPRGTSVEYRLPESAVAAVPPYLAFAWSVHYRKGMQAELDSVQGQALICIKRELDYNGYGGDGLILDSPMLGRSYHRNCVRFQTAHQLEADGVVGPRTAAVLFRQRALEADRTRGVPNKYTCRMLSLESGFDPGAIGGLDKDDTGLAQINLRIWAASVTVEQAVQAAYCVPWTAARLADINRRLRSWRGAVAAHNTGEYYAGKWVQAGYPVQGYILPSSGRDIFTIAHNYVRLVEAQACG